jgi:hypothetical protein
MNILYHNLIGVFAIMLGGYLLLNEYRLLTIVVGAIGLAVVFYGMKANMPKPLPALKSKPIQKKAVSKKKK